MNYVTPVEGLPFSKQTRVEIKWKLIEKSESSLVIRMRSDCKDSPNCDTFFLEEVIIVLGLKN